MSLDHNKHILSHGTPTDAATEASSPQATLEASVGEAQRLLEAGEITQAHLHLIALVRYNKKDPNVLFVLAFVRQMLGYDASAESLFRQAFDLGYCFDEQSPLEPDADNPNHLRWTEASGRFSLVLERKPRRRSLNFVAVRSTGSKDAKPASQGATARATPVAHDDASTDEAAPEVVVAPLVSAEEHAHEADEAPVTLENSGASVIEGEVS